MQNWLADWLIDWLIDRVWTCVFDLMPHSIRVCPFHRYALKFCMRFHIRCWILMMQMTTRHRRLHCHFYHCPVSFFCTYVPHEPYIHIYVGLIHREYSLKIQVVWHFFSNKFKTNFREYNKKTPTTTCFLKPAKPSFIKDTSNTEWKISVVTGFDIYLFYVFESIESIEIECHTYGDRHWSEIYWNDTNTIIKKQLTANICSSDE